MDIKLLLLDLDDTLLNSDGKLSKGIIDTIRKVRNKNILVTIASGRMHRSLLPYVDKLNSHGPVISFNGGLIINSKNDKTMFSNPVPLDIAKKVLKFADENNVFCQYFTNIDYYFVKHCEISDDYELSTNVSGIAIGNNLYNKIKVSPPKLLIIDDTDKMADVLKKVKVEFSNVLEITQSKSKYIEIMKKNVNKGSALQKICDIMNIPIKNTMAIGDGQNDIQMIKKAGIGVAVETGNEQLKKAADLICKGPNENGPAEIIDKYILNKT